MIKELLAKVAAKQDLSYEESESAISEIMSGECSPVLISAFLTALAMKGETENEIAGCADGMRAKALKMDLPYETLDIVGTGGDKSLSFNISTTAAFVIAAAGVKVTKHGNRAASSGSGAADCLEALGVNISADIDVMKKSIEKDNIAFLFAQKYHSAMRFVGPVRKEIGTRTVFNILGPLTNPAAAKMMVLGVFGEEYVEKVFGKDTLDEISACGETLVAEVRGGSIKYYTITPEQFGFERCKKSELIGGTPQENAAITRNVLSGGGTTAQKTAVLLNAGAGIFVAEKGKITLEEGVKKAERILKSGKALQALDEFVRITNE